MHQNRPFNKLIPTNKLSDNSDMTDCHCILVFDTVSHYTACIRDTVNDTNIGSFKTKKERWTPIMQVEHC